MELKIQVNNGANVDEIKEYIEEEFNTSHSFLVLDNEARYEHARKLIRQTIYTFTTPFIVSHLKKDFNRDSAFSVIDYIRKYLASGELEKSDVNEILFHLIDFDSFVDDAIKYDGYGHFLSSYDGTEYEFYDSKQNQVFIYIN